MEGFARVVQLLVADLDFLAAILALDQPCHVCWRLTAEPYVPGLPSRRCLALIREPSCFDLLRALNFVASLGICLFIHFVSIHLVSSWNVPSIVPVTELTALNRTDPKLDSEDGYGEVHSMIEWDVGEPLPSGSEKGQWCWSRDCRMSTGWEQCFRQMYHCFLNCIIFKRGDTFTEYKIPDI